MKVPSNRKLFWFLKDDIKLDLSEPSILDMYVQQTITYGSTEDIKFLIKNITLNKIKESFQRIKTFLPFEIRRFWEDFFENTQQLTKKNT